MQNRFPQILANLMKKKNVSQGELARHVGIARQSVGQYLAGKTEPSLSTLMEIAKFFDVPIDYLCGMESSEAFWLQKAFCQHLDTVLLQIEQIKAVYKQE